LANISLGEIGALGVTSNADGSTGKEGELEGTERRTHFRLPKEAKVTCQEVTYPLGTEPEFLVTMIDVSEGGVQVESGVPVEPGTLLQVSLSLEGWQRHTSSFLKHGEEMSSKPLTALGRVVRSASAGGERHLLGIQFVDIWDDHWGAMRQFLEREFRVSTNREG
jgi:hypothetical protein